MNSEVPGDPEHSGASPYPGGGDEESERNGSLWEHSVARTQGNTVAELPQGEYGNCVGTGKPGVPRLGGFGKIVVVGGWCPGRRDPSHRMGEEPEAQ